jgi:hypothetical protein
MTGSSGWERGFLKRLSARRTSEVGALLPAGSSSASRKSFDTPAGFLSLGENSPL